VEAELGRVNGVVGFGIGYYGRYLMGIDWALGSVWEVVLVVI